jgi:hypothetical protein
MLGNSSTYKGRLVFLPRNGYRCINVTEELHEIIKKRAKETNRTMREYVEYLIATGKAAKDGK